MTPIAIRDYTLEKMNVFERHANRLARIIIALAIVAMLGLYYLPR